ncbi:MAG: endolytic transglycosylase MltG [Firmicutes bacterium]|nr:endolytic transglycosylase MltG [Bacillota bacterium]
MDNEKWSDQPEDTSWLDELLSAPEVGEEISSDDNALSSLGLSGLDDMELEKIMKEAMSDDWNLEDPIEPSEPVPIHDEEYRDYSDEAEESAPAAETDAQEDAEPALSTRKVRPKRKGGYGLLGIPHLLSTIIWIVLCFAIAVSLGRLLWVCAADVLAFGREDQTVTISITASDDLESIIDKLYNAGLIQYKQLFRLYAQLANAENKISVGTFELNTLYDYHALVNGMQETSSYRQQVSVTIPEGYSCAQIFALLEEEGVCTAAELEAYAAESDFASYWFLEGTPRGDKYCLQGFLYPDTYTFYTNDTPKRVFIKFLERFDDIFSEEMQSYLILLNEKLSEKMLANGYDQTYVDEHQLSLYDVVIVASMVEKESSTTGDSYQISSVIYNRLTNPNFPYLNIDATLVYATGHSELTQEDLEVDSPYNTYTNEGLPPTPIANPGLISLQAALNPADTDYYYYALDPAEGEHHFSATYQEHLEFLESLEN